MCAHCSLRFGDIQRIKPSALSLSAQALRGLCWATKTTCQGQPFARLPFGFRGEDISTSWLVKWLALSQALDATHAERGDSFVPDFILPCIPEPQPFASDVLLASTRWAIQLLWKSEGEHEASSFTLHVQRRSYAFLKTAESFRVSALLHSRDDTIEALWLRHQTGLETPSTNGQHPTGTSLSGCTGQPSELIEASEPPTQPDKILVPQSTGSTRAALRRPNPTKNHQMSRRAHQIPRFARGRRPLQSIQLAFALCPGDPYMPCSALTATQYRQRAACI